MHYYFVFLLAVLALAGCGSGARSIPPRPVTAGAAVLPDTLVHALEGEPTGVLTLPA